MTATLTVTEAGRVDALIATAMPELSRAFVQKLLKEGRVLCRGKAVKKSYRPEPGDVLTLDIPEPEAPEIAAEDIPLEIVYEDKDVIVVNKPKGMVVHPAPGHAGGTLVNALMAHCGKELSGINGVLRPGIVHRIDKDTSGLIIAAKNDGAHKCLAEQLKDHTLSRTYECVVIGNLREDTGTVDAPIGRHPTDRKRMCVTEKNARPAVTHWEVLERFPGCTHLRCRLETGRTHQIRVHMAYTGHPLLGDTVYGGRRDKGLDTQCLHARGLKFIHPATGKPIELWTELPDWFDEVLGKLGAPL